MEKDRMKPNSLMLILRVCGYHFSGWRHNKRIIMSFLLAGIISFLLTDKVMNFSMEHHTTIQIFEPFIWVFGDGTSILLASLIAILLFADMPFLNGAVPYYLIRIRVRIWILGQLLYVACATVLYTLYILIITVLLCAQNAFPGNMWSPTAALLAYSEYADKIAVPAELKTFEMSKPYSCMLTIFLLLLLYVLLAVMIMFIVTLWKGQVIGAAAAFAFHLFGILLNSQWIGRVLGLGEKEQYIANIICGWLSPINQVTYYRHNFGFDMLPRLSDTYLIFGLAIIVFLFAIIHQMKRYNFHFLGTEEE